MTTPPNEIRFLNVDLEVRGRKDLQPLIDDLGDDVINLYSGRVHDHYLATFEVALSGDANELIQQFCHLIENLASEARSTWDEASLKVFDIGYEAGIGPKSYESNLRPETVAAVAALGAALRVTIYPPSSPSIG